MRKSILSKKIGLNNARTFKAFKNISYIFVFKVFSIILSFGIVRETYNYLNKEQYGIWLTIFSVLSWIGMLDIGLGNGLRNSLSESLANGDKDDGKIYVSTAHLVFGLFIVIVYIIYLFVSPLISWTSVFNIKTLSENPIHILLNFLIGIYLLILLFSLINQVALAFQDAAIPSLITFITNLIIFGALLFLGSIGKGSLNNIGILYGIITCIVILAFNVALYLTKYKRVLPSVLFIKSKGASKLFNLGMKFFVIQISWIVIFTTDNLIISQVLGPEKVVPYQIVYKLFSVITITHAIVLTPMWSAITEAYTIKDYKWIAEIMRKLIFLFMPFFISIVFLVITSKQIINFWIGYDVGVNFELVILMGVYVFITIWNNTFANFLNGIGEVNIQLISMVIGALANIPLSIFFSKNINLGINGVILGSILSLLLCTFLLPMQTFGLLKKIIK